MDIIPCTCGLFSFVRRRIPLYIDVYRFLHVYIVDPLVDHLLKGIAFLEQPNNAKGVLQIALRMGLDFLQTDYLVLEPCFAIVATQIKEALIRIQQLNLAHGGVLMGRENKNVFAGIVQKFFPVPEKLGNEPRKGLS